MTEIAPFVSPGLIARTWLYPSCMSLWCAWSRLTKDNKLVRHEAKGLLAPIALNASALYIEDYPQLAQAPWSSWLGPVARHMPMHCIGDTLSQVPMANCVLRYCASCLAHQFHSVVTQHPGVRFCPLHVRPLRTHCPHCFTPVVATFGAVIDCPFGCRRCRGPLFAGKENGDTWDKKSVTRTMETAFRALRWEIDTAKRSTPPAGVSCAILEGRAMESDYAAARRHCSPTVRIGRHQKRIRIPLRKRTPFVEWDVVALTECEQGCRVAVRWLIARVPSLLPELLFAEQTYRFSDRAFVLDRRISIAATALYLVLTACGGDLHLKPVDSFVHPRRHDRDPNRGYPRRIYYWIGLSSSYPSGGPATRRLIALEVLAAFVAEVVELRRRSFSHRPAFRLPASHQQLFPAWRLESCLGGCDALLIDAPFSLKNVVRLAQRYASAE